MNEQFRTTTLTGDEMKKIARIGKCRARFDILHFEEITTSEDDFLDPRLFVNGRGKNCEFVWWCRHRS